MLCCCLLVLGGLASNQLYGQCCDNCPQDLPDGNSATFDVFVVDDPATPADECAVPVDQVSMNFTHEYIGDLQIDVTNPSGTTVTLVGPVGFTPDSGTYDLTFEDGTANGAWVNPGAPGTGTYDPNSGTIASLNSADNCGTWTFTVLDNQFVDSGVFNDFGVSNSGSGPLNCTSTPLPATCMLSLPSVGGAGYNQCAAIQADFDAAGGFGGFPGFTAAQDPCSFCSASSVGPPDAGDPTLGLPCQNVLTGGGTFSVSYVVGPDMVFDPCTAGTTPTFCDPGGPNESPQFPYTGDGCSASYVTWAQTWTIPDPIPATDPLGQAVDVANCPCAGACVAGGLLTQGIFACSEEQADCSGLGLLELALTPIPGTCDTAPSLTIEATCPLDGTVVTCDVLVETAPVPICGESGTVDLGYSIANPALEAALIAGGLPEDACLAAPVSVPFNCACCDQVFDYEVDDACANTPITFVQQPGCDPGSPDQFGIELDLDFYFYTGAPTSATDLGPAAGYNPLPATDNTFPSTNTDLTNIGGLGGTWNGTICADLAGPALANTTCAPLTYTFFVLPWDRDFDSDGDGVFGEYNVGGGGECTWERIDVVVWPDGLVVVETPGVCDGAASSVVVNAADGTECAAATAATSPTTPADCGMTVTDMFMYSFTAADLGLDMAPAACQPTFMGQIDVPCTSIACCDVTDPIVVSVESCEGAGSATLTASGDADCQTINWYSDAAGTTLVGTGTSYTPTDTAPGTYTYYAECFNPTGTGCSSALVAGTFTINTLPVPTLDTPTLACSGEVLALNPMPAGGVFSGTGASFVDAAGTAIVANYADVMSEGVVYDLTYTLTDASGCVGEITIPIQFIVDCGANGGQF